MKLSNKFCLVIVGFLLSIIIIEIIFQIMGFAAFSIQRYGYLQANKKYEDHYRILALGESTTADLFNGQSTWPAELEKILNNKSQGKTKFKVFNEGIPAATSIVILSKLERLLEKHKPDLVITMIGYNDPVNAALMIDDKDVFSKLKLPKFLFWLKMNLEKKNPGLKNECMKAAPDDFESEIIRAQTMIDSNDINKANDAIIRIEANHPYCYAYCRLGNLYGELGRKSRSDEKEYFGKKAIEQFEKGREYYSECKIPLVFFYLRDTDNLSSYVKAEQIIKDLIIDDPQAVSKIEGSLFGSLSAYIEEAEMKQDTMPGFFYLYGYDNIRINKEYDREAKSNYQFIHETIKNKGIRHFAMQYPRQDVNQLKAVLNSAEDIIFISNEANFENALADASWEQIFIDIMGQGNKSRYGGKPFGHTTLLGNKLIAENAAEVILKELNITS
jgi:hypothetical protein